jgi:hypothetical protein
MADLGFYTFTTYVSIVNNYAPFPSPVSLLTHGLSILQMNWIAWHSRIDRNTHGIVSGTHFHNPRPLPPQVNAGPSQETTQLC